MAIMRRRKGLSLRRRVPNRYASIEPQREIWLSLHTDSETIARQKEGRVWQEQIEAWEARLAGDTAEAEARHAAARRLAEVRGYPSKSIWVQAIPTRAGLNLSPLM